jgi:hypothetical protein
MVEMRPHVLWFHYPEGGRAFRALKHLIFLVNHLEWGSSASEWLLRWSYVMMMVVVVMHHGELLLDGGRARLALGQLLRCRMQGERLHALEVPWVRHVRLAGFRNGPSYLAVSDSTISTINSTCRSI